MAEQISLEKVLQAYRVLNASAKDSFNHKIGQSYSSPDYLVCDAAEKKQFEKVLDNTLISFLPSMYAKEGVVKSTHDLINQIHDPRYEKIKKQDRELIYSTETGLRPTDREAWTMWNGFQVIDMDIKNEQLARQLKPVIFNRLHKCNWFLGVIRSTSGSGLHVYTKITVPQDIKGDYNKMRLLFLANYRHKFSFVYIACKTVAEELGFTTDDLKKWLDVSMARPQQGAYIPYDVHPLINTGFFSDFIYFSFDNVEEIGAPEIDWITNPELRQIFQRWEWFISEDDQPEVAVLDSPDPEFRNNTKVHYKHHERWRLANTLVCLYEPSDPSIPVTRNSKSYKYLRAITSNQVKDKELLADCQTAKRHKKPVDTWAVNRLNRVHGFKIKLSVEDKEIKESELFTSMEMVGNPNSIIESKWYKEFHINKDQYLGSLISGKIDLERYFRQITLLEAGPGLGKTEMVKMLVRGGKKIMMVQPFTSIIKSKVEQEEGWYNSYGSRKPNLNVEHGLALTLDKFSRLNMMDVKASGFDYIFIDESHLIFMSEYRPIMSQVINQIRSSEVPVIMMSGTPIGELVFFNDIMHIKVIKEETRKKQLEVCLVNDQGTLIYHMCRSIARDIANKKRVLFPSNEGTLFFKRVVAGVQYFLEQEHMIFDEVKSFYYKKANLGLNEMNWINFEKTIKDTQLLMCTTYAGAGVDIMDKLDFEIYFADICTAAECDQWCNRLRNNNLFVHMYVAKNDADGNSRNVMKFQPLNLRLNDDEIKDIHSILRLCNGMIERNPIDYKYNSLISSIVQNNQYIKFDEIKNQYVLDELAYKVVFFERKYRDFAQQLPVFSRGMELYGYEVTTNDLGEFKVQNSEVFQDIKNRVKQASDLQQDMNMKDIEELLDQISEDRLDVYKDVLAGKYEIKRGDKFKEDTNNMVMTVKNVEVFEKVVPTMISLSRNYEIDKVKDMFEFCRKPNGHFNFAALSRLRSLLNMVNSREKKQLDFPIEVFMDEAYAFADREVCNKQDLKDFIVTFAGRYARKESTPAIPIDKSELTTVRLADHLMRLFKCLVNVSRPAKDGTIHMERIEVLWKKREYMSGDKNNNLYFIEDFIDSKVDEETITITHDAEQEECPF